jgi:hypothetical protein
VMILQLVSTATSDMGVHWVRRDLGTKQRWLFRAASVLGIFEIGCSKLFALAGFKLRFFSSLPPE